MCIRDRLAADAQVQVGTGLAAHLGSHLHQLAHAHLVQLGKGIVLIDLLVIVSAQEPVSYTHLMGKCCVSGCGAIVMDEENKQFTLAGKTYHEGDWLSLDGSTGSIYDLSLIHI